MKFTRELVGSSLQRASSDIRRVANVPMQGIDRAKTTCILVGSPSGDERAKSNQALKLPFQKQERGTYLALTRLA